MPPTLCSCSLHSAAEVTGRFRGRREGGGGGGGGALGAVPFRPRATSAADLLAIHHSSIIDIIEDARGDAAEGRFEESHRNGRTYNEAEQLCRAWGSGALGGAQRRDNKQPSVKLQQSSRFVHTTRSSFLRRQVRHV